jgi:hypothetical protein
MTLIGIVSVSTAPMRAGAQLVFELGDLRSAIATLGKTSSFVTRAFVRPAEPPPATSGR